MGHKSTDVRLISASHSPSPPAAALVVVELHFDGEIDFPIIVFWGNFSYAAAIIHKEEKKKKSSSSMNGFYWNYHRRRWMGRTMKNKRTMMMLVKGRQRQRRSEIRCRRSFISGGSG